MKTTVLRLATLTFAATLILGAGAHAAVTGINTPGSSFASINFDDTASLNSSSLPGTTNITPTISPWGGPTWSLPLTTDPVTFDQAQADLMASVIFGNYDIAISNLLLTQLAVNTGQALLRLQFNVEFQIGGTGLPAQPTLFPNFVASGTVQPAFGSFATIAGFIDYYTINTAGLLGLVETVNYGQTFNTAGPFSAIIPGIPVNGTTPAILAGNTLTLVGDIRFIVDPATINVHTVAAPEPGSALLALSGGALLGFLRRRA